MTAKARRAVDGGSAARLTVAASLVAVLAAGDALAQGGNTATAEALFRQGRQLMDAKDFVRACPRLAESYRLDPATGALLALATCHEGEGKLASAWSEFSLAASRAQSEGRADRVAVAKERAQAIEPRLSLLTVTVPDGVAALPGFELKRGGEVLGKAVIGVGLPVDGGDHVVEVTATGKKTWKTSVTVGREKDKKTVLVPALEDAAVAGPGTLAPNGGQSAALDVTTVPGPKGLTGMQIGGIVAAGLGVAGIAVGSVFGLKAIGKNNDSKSSGCSGSVCADADAVQARDDARSAGNVATIAFVAGGVLAATGVTLLVVGKPKRSEQASMSVVPSVAANHWGLSMQGAF
jgi:hypothetical protein